MANNKTSKNNGNANVPYYSTSSLGAPNDEAAAGNPLKGFLTNPDWSSPPYLDSLPSSLEFYCIGLDKVMTGPNTFDWDTHLEPRLEDTASRNKHAIIRFQLDNPGLPSFVPQFLVDGGLNFNSYTAWGGGQSPDYTDENLLQALGEFIAAFGAKYDGDQRLGFVQVGLLGFRGEWHTHTDGSGATESWIPNSTKDFVVEKFDAAFDITPLQMRRPYATSNQRGFGFHDSSFAHSTLDGEANGGGEVSCFFWPSVVSARYTDFWKTSVMGSELRPELQDIIFSDSYPTATNFHQDFNLCIEVTHLTYSLNCYAFSTGYTGADLTRAIAANHRMGYAFRITRIEATEGTDPTIVDVSVTVEQAGVAPFYYPLGLTLECPDGTSSTLPGVDTIVNEGDSQVFTFNNIPANLECLDPLRLSLSSEHVYSGNPVKFAQGSDGTTVSVSVPLPPISTQCTTREGCLGDGTTNAVVDCGEIQCNTSSVEDDIDRTTATMCQDDALVITKTQLKKIRRYERCMEKKRQKKQIRKERKRALAIEQGRDLEAEQRQIAELTKLGIGAKRRQEEWEERVKSAESSFQVCIDCAYEHQMTPKEINSLATQIRNCYSANKKSKNPCYLSVSSLKGETLNHLEKVKGFPEQWFTRAFDCSCVKSLDEMHPNTKRLVYLTSDSDNELEHLDDSKIYVIGGIVDRNRLPQAAMKRAENLGLATAKLPITRFLKLSTTKVLTCNHVFEIMMKYREYGNNWESAMLDVLPQRKNARPLEEGNDSKCRADT